MDEPQGAGVSEPGAEGVAQVVVPQIADETSGEIGIALAQSSLVGAAAMFMIVTVWLHVLVLPQQSSAFSARDDVWQGPVFVTVLRMVTLTLVAHSQHRSTHWVDRNPSWNPPAPSCWNNNRTAKA